MKTLGLIGGLSWESTSVYYSHLNRLVQQRLGGLHSAKCLLYSFDFEEIATMQRESAWDAATDKMIEAAKCLEKGGADCLVICTNTMHRMANEVKQACQIPLVHIVDCVAHEIKSQGISKVALLGTKYTMEQTFYRDHMQQHGIDIVIPDDGDREVIHSIIYQELCKGVIQENSKLTYLDIIDKLHRNGAEGVILGCTEITLLINQEDTPIPLFDSTFIHAKHAVDFAFTYDDMDIFNRF